MSMYVCMYAFNTYNQHIYISGRSESRFNVLSCMLRLNTLWKCTNYVHWAGFLASSEAKN